MASMMSDAPGRDFFGIAAELARRGERFATVTVVRAERPTSGKPGDKAIVTEEGEMVGFIGGSCAEPAVIEEALQALSAGEPRFVRLSPSPGRTPVSAGIKELRMTCFSGGTMDIYIEPQTPAPALLVVGTAPVAVTLARLRDAMGYRVTQIDPARVDSEGVDPEGVDHQENGLDREEVGRPGARTLFGSATLGAATFVVVACHGNYDDVALTELLARLAAGEEIAYVGLVASRKRSKAVLRRLQARGVEHALVERIRSPAGLGEFGRAAPDALGIICSSNRREAGGPL